MGGGDSSGSTWADEDPDARARMEQRRKRRMESNRESARRSRMRKQRHLDELNAKVTQMEQMKEQMVAALEVTTRSCVGIEAENSVLRTRMAELTHRLAALNDILHLFRHHQPPPTTIAARSIGGPDGGFHFQPYRCF